jgi:hypothetical protein
MTGENAGAIASIRGVRVQRSFRKDWKTMKTMNIPGFNAEASLGSVVIFGTRRANKGTLATETVSPAIQTGPGGGGGYYCSPDDPNCVDCTDDVENIVCAECNAGGSLQCCQDPIFCVANPRPTIDCTDPVTAKVCIECDPRLATPGGGFFCCIRPPCNVIPPRTLPPTCIRVGARVICGFGVPTTFANFASVS